MNTSDFGTVSAWPHQMFWYSVCLASSCTLCSRRVRCSGCRIPIFITCAAVKLTTDVIVSQPMRRKRARYSDRPRPLNHSCTVLGLVKSSYVLEEGASGFVCKDKSCTGNGISLVTNFIKTYFINPICSVWIYIVIHVFTKAMYYSPTMTTKPWTFGAFEEVIQNPSSSSCKHTHKCT